MKIYDLDICPGCGSKLVHVASLGFFIPYSGTTVIQYPICSHCFNKIRMGNKTKLIRANEQTLALRYGETETQS